MMTGGHMNGAYSPQQVEQPQATVSVTTNNAAPPAQPLVTITPPVIRITAAQVWAAILALPATAGVLVSLGIFYVPAKEAELKALIAVVQQVQVVQEDSSKAIKRLTEAVDNLSGLVVKIPKPKNLTGAVKLR